MNEKFRKEKKLDIVLDFIMPVAFEHKVGKTNNLESFKNLSEVNIYISKALNEVNENIKESEEEKFLKKYYSKGKYYYFDSIFNYITGRNAFDIDLLKKELGEYFKDNGKISEYDDILNKLGYWGFLELSDREYRNFTYKMLSFLDKGMYQLKQYGTIFHFVTRFDNKLNFDLQKLKLRFIRGINKGISHYKYEPFLKDHLISYNWSIRI